MSPNGEIEVRGVGVEAGGAAGKGGSRPLGNGLREACSEPGDVSLGDPPPNTLCSRELPPVVTGRPGRAAIRRRDAVVLGPVGPLEPVAGAEERSEGADVRRREPEHDLPLRRQGQVRQLPGTPTPTASGEHQPVYLVTVGLGANHNPGVRGIPTDNLLTEAELGAQAGGDGREALTRR
jgi:hypothetical protein